MLEDGIYFDLPEEDHHADPALGSGDHKKLLISPPRWWLASSHAAEFRGQIDMIESEEESLAKLFGHAAHVLTLEGEETFQQRYWCEEDPPPGLLATKEDIAEEYLERFGQRLFKGMSLTDMVLEARMKGLGPLLEDWKRAKFEENLGKAEISRRWMNTMRLIERMLLVPRQAYDGKSVREKYLTNGRSEVTVIVTLEDGLRIKARFDFLRLKSIIDVKTFMAREDEETIAAFGRSVSNYAYDMQAALYLEVRSHMPRLIAEGRVFGDHDDAWLQRLAREDKITWAWIAIQTAGMPEVDVLEFENTSLVWQSAKYQIDAARRNYLEFRDRFGMDSPWVTDRGRITMDDQTFEAMGLMRRMTGRGEQAWKLP